MTHLTMGSSGGSLDRGRPRLRILSRRAVLVTTFQALVSLAACTVPRPEPGVSPEPLIGPAPRRWRPCRAATRAGLSCQPAHRGAAHADPLSRLCPTGA